MAFQRRYFLSMVFVAVERLRFRKTTDLTLEHRWTPARLQKELRRWLVPPRSASQTRERARTSMQLRDQLQEKTGRSAKLQLRKFGTR